jgi:L,D-transpeptidase YcbB
VKRLRNLCTGPGPVHSFRKMGGVAAALIAVAAPLFPAQAAQVVATATAVSSQPAAEQSLADFYRARRDAPLWLAPNSGNAAERLIALLSTASLDGLNPDRYQTAALQQSLQLARSGKRKAVSRADQQLSEAFVAYVRDLRRDPGLGILYVDPDLKPASPSAMAALLQAASAPSLASYVQSMGWMNPLYGQLRQALANRGFASEHERQLLTVNLERARALPSGPQRYVLVNAAQQRLYMYANGQMVDSMRVVVGKPKYPTPMMSAWIRYASLNPYWYVPPDLAAERIAPNTVRRGLGYLDELGYQVLSDWGPDAQIIDPSTIDWKAVADGKKEVMIRQLPGAHNSMGRIKFMFPNDVGVYLHDNPERELFEQAARLYSGGCVRLEDAWRLSRWLFGRDLTWEGAGTEEQVPLQAPVPVYITYLTAMPEGSAIAYYDDVYGRDAARLASMGSNVGTAAAAGAVATR